MSAKNLKSATTKVVINNMTFDVSNSFICPITRQVMVQPLKTPSGVHFERTAILSWLKGLGTCPLTLSPLQVSDLTPNTYLESQIKIWRRDNGLSLDGNSEDFNSLDNDVIRCFLSLSSKDEVESIDLTCSPKIVSPVDNKGVRNNGARWSILRRQKMYYAPLA
jgi:hypothetical protein